MWSVLRAFRLVLFFEASSTVLHATKAVDSRSRFGQKGENCSIVEA